MKQINPEFSKEMTEHSTHLSEPSKEGLKVNFDSEKQIMDEVRRESRFEHIAKLANSPIHGFVTLLNWNAKKELENSSKKHLEEIEASIRKRQKQIRFFYAALGVHVILLSIAVFFYSNKTEEIVPLAQINFKPTQEIKPINKVQENLIPSENSMSPLKASAPKIKNIPTSSLVSFPVVETKPYVFSGFTGKMDHGVVRFDWVDQEINSCIYMIQKSEDGSTFDVAQIIQGVENEEANRYIATENNISPYFRLVKVVHGAGVFISPNIQIAPENSVQEKIVDPQEKEEANNS